MYASEFALGLVTVAKNSCSLITLSMTCVDKMHSMLAIDFLNLLNFFNAMFDLTIL